MLREKDEVEVSHEMKKQCPVGKGPGDRLAGGEGAGVAILSKVLPLRKKICEEE